VGYDGHAIGGDVRGPVQGRAAGQAVRGGAGAEVGVMVGWGERGLGAVGLHAKPQRGGGAGEQGSKGAEGQRTWRLCILASLRCRGSSLLGGVVHCLPVHLWTRERPARRGVLLLGHRDRRLDAGRRVGVDARRAAGVWGGRIDPHSAGCQEICSQGRAILWVGGNGGHHTRRGSLLGGQAHAVDFATRM
jgi:hypothetical protein